MKVYTAKQIRKIEQLTENYGINTSRLMENAGAVVTKEICDNFDVLNGKTVVLCGNGNNGGDGYVTARKLFEMGADVTVISVLGGSVTENAKQTSDAYSFFGGKTVDYSTDAAFCLKLVENANLIVDAVFGIGLNRNVKGNVLKLFNAVNRANAFVVSVDIPSGICADTGLALGGFIKADLTVTFIGYKFCNLLFPGADICGKTVVGKIGIPPEIDNYAASSGEINEAPVICKRKRNTNKGSYGNALLICGSYGMAGAAVLALKAALKSGVGLCKAVVPKSIYPIVAASVPEAVFFPVDENDGGTLSLCGIKSVADEIKKADCVLFGPGIGNGKDRDEILNYLYLNVKNKFILDADGINALSKSISFTSNGAVKLIITPHPGEMARLLNTTVADVEQNRVKYATYVSEKYHCVTVLKGAVTIIAGYDGKIKFNINGNPGMATGGSGDVLSGILAGLNAVDGDIFASTCKGVYIHAASGDKAADEFSETSVLPSDIINKLPEIYKEFGE